MIELYLLSGGMVPIDSWVRYNPSTIKLTSPLSLCAQWNPSIFSQWLGMFLSDLMKLPSLYTMRNLSLKAKSRQYVLQHPISRHRLREWLGHYHGVIPISIYDTYCWGHFPRLTNQNYVLKWRHKYVNEGWWHLGHHTCIKVCAYLQGTSLS